MEKQIRVAIVEDTDIIRESLKMLVDMTDNLSCINVYANAEDAVKDIPLHCPDVVLMDIELPGMNGVEAVRILKAKCTETQFMMSTIFDDEENIFEALKAGATGYILKKTNPAKIIEAIFEIHNGGAPMSGQIARKVLMLTQQNPKQKINNTMLLTDRETEVLMQLSKGLRYKEIADQLNISITTVRTHIHKIYEKLQVSSRTDALNKAFQN